MTHLRIITVFGRFEIPLGGSLDTGGGDTGNFQIFTSSTGTAISQPKVVVRGASPVTVTFEEETVLGVGVEIEDRGVEFNPLAGVDAPSPMDVKLGSGRTGFLVHPVRPRAAMERTRTSFLANTLMDLKIKGFGPYRGWILSPQVI